MERRTELGTIKISDNIFERLIKDSLALTEGRDSLAPGRKNIFVHEEDGYTLIEFHICHMFGTSIRHSSKLILDNMESVLRPLLDDKPIRIKMKIVAVKSRKEAKRNLEYERVLSLQDQIYES